MTTLEALKNSVNYPLSSANVLTCLIGRGISESDASNSFSQEVAKSKEYRLAYADVLRFLITMVNLSQGGSVTQAAVDQYRGTANSIYKEYGETLIGNVADTTPTVKDITEQFD